MFQDLAKRLELEVSDDAKCLLNSEMCLSFKNIPLSYFYEREHHMLVVKLVKRFKCVKIHKMCKSLLKN